MKINLAIPAGGEEARRLQRRCIFCRRARNVIKSDPMAIRPKITSFVAPNIFLRESISDVTTFDKSSDTNIHVLLTTDNKKPDYLSLSE